MRFYSKLPIKYGHAVDQTHKNAFDRRTAPKRD